MFSRRTFSPKFERLFDIFKLEVDTVWAFPLRRVLMAPKEDDVAGTKEVGGREYAAQRGMEVRRMWPIENKKIFR